MDQDFPDLRKRKHQFLHKVHQKEKKKVQTVRAEAAAVRIQSFWRAHIVRKAVTASVSALVKKRIKDIKYVRSQLSNQKYEKVLMKAFKGYPQFRQFVVFAPYTEPKLLASFAQVFVQILFHEMEKSSRILLSRLIKVTVKRGVAVAQSFCQTVAKLMAIPGRLLCELKELAVVLTRSNPYEVGIQKELLRQGFKIRDFAQLLNIFLHSDLPPRAILTELAQHNLKNTKALLQKISLKDFQIAIGQSRTLLEEVLSVESGLNEVAFAMSMLEHVVGQAILQKEQELLVNSLHEFDQQFVRNNRKQFKVQARSSSQFKLFAARANLDELMAPRLLACLTKYLRLSFREISSARTVFIGSFSRLYSKLFGLQEKWFLQGGFQGELLQLAGLLHGWIKYQNLQERLDMLRNSEDVATPLLFIYSNLFYGQYRFLSDQQFAKRWREEDQLLSEGYSFFIRISLRIFESQIETVANLRALVFSILSDLNSRNNRLNLFDHSFWELAYTHTPATKVGSLIFSLPFLFRFEERFAVLRKFLAEIKSDDYFQPHTDHIVIRRGRELEDAERELRFRDLRNKLYVRFVNQFGNFEEGIDGGGLTRELISRVANEIFNPKNKLFRVTEVGTLVPSQFAKPQKFKFVGKIFGKAILENILLEPVFGRTFLNQVLGLPNSIDDLQTIEPTLYKSLCQLRNHKTELGESCLTFSLRSGDSEVELVQNGRHIAVSQNNLERYIFLYSNYVMNQSTQQSLMYFREGLFGLVDLKLIKLFTNEELQRIISGESKPFDLADLRNNIYLAGYLPTDATILALWEVLGSFSVKELDKFLFYVTGCSRPPIEGFRAIHPKVGIVKLQKGIQALPEASTCVNLLKLPDYGSAAILRQKLLYAINSNSGFQMG